VCELRIDSLAAQNFRLNRPVLAGFIAGNTPFFRPFLKKSHRNTAKTGIEAAGASNFHKIRLRNCDSGVVFRCKSGAAGRHRRDAIIRASFTPPSAINAHHPQA
jgi:hypothetical protein